MANQLLKIDFVQAHLNRASEFLREQAPVSLRQYAAQWFDELCLIESPLEAAFWIWWHAVEMASYPGARIEIRSQRQVVIGTATYRLDFVVEAPDFSPPGILEDAARFELKLPQIAIELDGHEFHERTKEQVSLRDRRDRDLQAAGWRVFHISGSEFHRSADACIRDLYQTCFKIHRQFHFDVLNRKYPDDGLGT